ncbi:ArdC family protein [Thiocapsa marina]|uniref:Polyvalent protein metallopeptidase domain-containing protein n=1 Tax=Thiocapsa marina 5811 TaxID=768671 RepID=F9U9P1_9GAMM|nr:zincin-like metallopeptidase domain-containing protein [Thiocapsa marina]EGV18839.1 protein of unknown function DUF1738 [Thiocapsa marina 5811]
MAITAATFRSNQLIQIEESMMTGLSIKTLLDRIASFHGKKHIDDVLYAEYPGDGDFWSIECLKVSAICDLVDFARRIEIAAQCNIADIAVKSANAHGGTYLRNLAGKWNGADEMRDINARLTKMILERIQDLIKYLGDNGILNNSGESIAELDDFPVAYDFVSSTPVKSLDLDSVLLTIHRVRQKNQSSSIIEQLKEFEFLEARIKLSGFRKLLSFSAKHVNSFPAASPEPPSKPKTDFAIIVDGIIGLIQKNQAGIWIRPWIKDSILMRPINYHTKNKYKGINTINLWVAASENNYESHYWATEKQWEIRSLKVQDGAVPTKVFVAFPAKRDRNEEDEEKEQGSIQKWHYRSWNVFNACQLCDYDQNKHFFKPNGRKTPIGKVSESKLVDGFINKTKADIRFGGNTAYYRVSEDYIKIPNVQQFTDTSQATATQGYYATLLHELTHWSGHESRQKRNLKNKFGTPAYAFEELIAELGTAFLCADLGILNVPREAIDNQFGVVSTVGSEGGSIINHAAYIDSWVKAMKGDPVKYIVRAAGLSEKAVDYLEGLQAA